MEITTMGKPVTIPSPHRYISLQGNAGAPYYLYGYRAHDTTARFTLVHENPSSGDRQVVLVDADWPTIFRWMGDRGWPNIETRLRSVLPA